MSDNNTRREFDPRPRSMAIVLVVTHYGGLDAGTKALQGLMEIEAASAESQKPSEFAGISAFLLNVSTALGVPARLMVEDRNGVHAESWERAAKRVLEAILSDDEVKSRALEFIQDVSTFGVLHRDAVLSMMRMTSGGERKGWAKASGE